MGALKYGSPGTAGYLTTVVVEGAAVFCIYVSLDFILDFCMYIILVFL